VRSSTPSDTWSGEPKASTTLARARAGRTSSLRSALRRAQIRPCIRNEAGPGRVSAPVQSNAHTRGSPEGCWCRPIATSGSARSWRASRPAWPRMTAIRSGYASATREGIEPSLGLAWHSRDLGASCASCRTSVSHGQLGSNDGDVRCESAAAAPSRRWRTLSPMHSATGASLRPTTAGVSLCGRPGSVDDDLAGAAARCAMETSASQPGEIASNRSQSDGRRETEICRNGDRIPVRNGAFRSVTQHSEPQNRDRPPACARRARRRNYGQNPTALSALTF
jgi:hypothetical protein